jgi:ribosomal protein L32
MFRSLYTTRLATTVTRRLPTQHVRNYTLAAPLTWTDHLTSIRFNINYWEQLRNLWESILRAVPKKKTSHSKKRMRAANKGLKNREDIVPCPGCGRQKLMAHVCRHCLRDIRLRHKHGHGLGQQVITT